MNAEKRAKRAKLKAKINRIGHHALAKGGKLRIGKHPAGKTILAKKVAENANRLAAENLRRPVSYEEFAAQMDRVLGVKRER